MFLHYAFQLCPVITEVLLRFCTLDKLKRERKLEFFVCDHLPRPEEEKVNTLKIIPQSIFQQKQIHTQLFKLSLQLDLVCHNIKKKKKMRNGGRGSRTRFGQKL